jgi:hypothetical protein
MDHPGKNSRPTCKKKKKKKNNYAKRTGGMAQVVEYLPRKRVSESRLGATKNKDKYSVAN